MINWTVLLIGGASGTGKSTIAYGLGKHYGISVMEVDDIYEAVKSMTTIESHPAIHYWDTGVNWREVSIEDNTRWLNNVSLEMMPAIKAIMDRRIEDKLPIIIEGDFIYPNLASLIDQLHVKVIFVNQSNEGQILQNYFNREGGDLQEYRAKISASYNNHLQNLCKKSESRRYKWSLGTQQ